MVGKSSDIWLYITPRKSVCQLASHFHQFFEACRRGCHDTRCSDFTVLVISRLRFTKSISASFFTRASRTPSGQNVTTERSVFTSDTEIDARTFASELRWSKRDQSKVCESVWNTVESMGDILNDQWCVHNLYNFRECHSLSVTSGYSRRMSMNESSVI